MAGTDPFALVGQLLDGQFRVDAMIGEGGFSVVYRGHHVGLDEPIAIKCLKLTGNLSSALVESFVTRFRDEAKLLYRLSAGNLNIVRSIASGTVTARGTNAMVPYIVLEWLDGISLVTDLDERRAAGKTGRTIGEVLDLFASAADALGYAHAQGVVHRDLNPGNVFLSIGRDGTMRTKVLDFGLAKVVSDHAMVLGPKAQSFAQIRVFSPAYAAPEQFDIELGPAGPATDVYSFANLMTEALLDHPMLDGQTLGELFAQTLDPNRARTPKALGAAIGPATEAVFKKALAMRPQDRFPDVATFWSTLEEAVSIDGADDPLAARKTMKMERPPMLDEPPPPATDPTADQLKALKQTARMPNAGRSTPPTAAPAPTPSAEKSGPVGAIVAPAASIGSDPDPAQPLVVVQKGLDPARHRPTVMTRRPADVPDVSPQRAPTVVTRPAAEGSGRNAKLLVGLLVFFAIVSVGTATLLVVQRMSGH